MRSKPSPCSSGPWREAPPQAMDARTPPRCAPLRPLPCWPARGSSCCYALRTVLPAGQTRTLVLPNDAVAVACRLRRRARHGRLMSRTIAFIQCAAARRMACKVCCSASSSATTLRRLVAGARRRRRRVDWRNNHRYSLE